MNETEAVIWMKCPYVAELCDAPATLSDLQFPVDEGWTARLTCAAGHRFIISQPERQDED